MNELKPCPFTDCQSKNISVVEGDGCWVYCWDCGSAGPTRDTPEEAVAAWNTRVDKCAHCEKLACAEWAADVVGFTQGVED